MLQVRGRVTQGASECLVMLDEDMDSEAGMEYLIDGQGHPGGSVNATGSDDDDDEDEDMDAV